MHYIFIVIRFCPPHPPPPSPFLLRVSVKKVFTVDKRASTPPPCMHQWLLVRNFDSQDSNYGDLMEEHNITDSQWQVAWPRAPAVRLSRTTAGQSTFLLSWQRVLMWRRGLFLRVAVSLLRGGCGPGGCKGHSCTNKSLPWDGGSV